MNNPTDKLGRHYLLTGSSGGPFQPNKPCYWHTRQEAEEALVHHRVINGAHWSFVDSGKPPTCIGNNPDNGSNCELPYGHDGCCSYTETDGSVRSWSASTPVEA